MKKRIFCWLLICVMLFSSVPFSAVAEIAVEKTTSTWEYETTDGGILLTKYNGTAADVYIPNEVDGLTVIGLADGIFEDNDALNSATLATGIQTIGEKAFYDCDQLVTIVTNEELTTIGSEAFHSCDVFNSIILYDAVTTIGENAFAECSSLTIWCNEETVSYTYIVENNISYEILSPEATPETYTQDGLTFYILNGEAIIIGYDNSINEFVIPTIVEGTPVTEVREAFVGAGYISVILPNSLRRIGINAFRDSSIASIIIPESVTQIDENAFRNCDQLTQLVLPGTLQNVGYRSFYDCSNLESVVIEEGITSLDGDAFRYCTKLTKLSLPASLSQMGTGIFANCEALTEVVIPENLSAIPAAAFEGCSQLKTINISEGVTYIDGRAFMSCGNLTDIVLPESIKTISSRAFLDCNNIQTIHIPQGVEELFTDSFPFNTVLSVYENSYAHTYALKNNLLYFVCSEIAEPEFLKSDGVTYYILNEEAIAIDFDESTVVATIPSEISGYPVTTLRETFKECSNLEKVILSEGIVKIGSNAFYNCAKLTEIKIPETVTVFGRYAFYNCKSLSSVEIPNGVQSIGRNAFYNCSSLTEVFLPSSITSLGWYAFYGCTGLTEINIPSSITSIEDHSFENCSNLLNVMLPEGLIRINSKAFYNCGSLQKIVIPKSVEYINETAFNTNTVLVVYENSYAQEYAENNDKIYIIWDGENEPQLIESEGITYCISKDEAIAVRFNGSQKEVAIPEKINDYPVVELRSTFRDCTEITTVTLPNSLKTIGANSFYNCTALNEIIIPDNVEKIGNNAFSGCSKLTSFVMPDSVTELGTHLFSNAVNLESVVLSNNISEITYAMFDNCDSLKEIVIPNGVTSIGAHAFTICDALVRVELPNSLLTIEEYAFWGCFSLKDIEFHDGLEKIGGSSFLSTALPALYIPKTVTTLGSSIVDGCDLEMVLVPESVTKMSTQTFEGNVVILVYENSFAHVFAVENDLLYFVLQKTDNPDIAYGSGITGTVKYTDGTVSSGATVEIFYEDGALKETVMTDETGAYEFTYAEVGAYTIKVTDANGNTATGAVSVKRMNAFDVFLAGDTDITLKQGWTVSGSVSAASATVTLTDEDGNIISSATAEDGNFIFENVPNGTYILKAKTETGSVTQEITVFNGDISGILLTVETSIATVWGYVEVKDRDFNHNRRNWVQVTIYNEEGVAVDQCKSDGDGKYIFANLPVGEYTVVAETSEMRKDKTHGFDRSHTLTGYAYVDASVSGEYQVETIVLYEENDHLATVSGKVTARGENNTSEVVLRNVFRHEVAKLTTGKNGKYTFKNIKDGLYFITATTESDGMGFALVTVRNGKVYGETDITVYKSDKIKDREDRFRNEVPECESREDAYQHKDRIAEEKRFYDGLSDKEKKQLSKDYLDRLNRYSEWLANTEYTTNDETVKVEQGGLVVSGDELEKEDIVTFNLNVEKYQDFGESTDGVHNDRDFIHHNMRDASGKGKIKEYYEITMTKTVDGEEQAVTSVHKDTDATGKFRITMEVPEEYRGHKHYRVLHVHHGEVVSLVDLDDDPNTVTFEVDRFSTFALSATDEELTEVIDFTAGDVNTDGSVDLLDAIILLQKLSGKLPETVTVDLCAANVIETYEGEYEVNAADLTRLLQYITGVRVDGALVELNASSTVPSII